MATTCTDVVGGAYCDPKQIREFFEMARDTVRAEVTRISYDTPSFWVGFMPTGTFQLGKGYQQQQKYYEQSYIEAHTAWRSVKTEVDAGRGCNLAPELIDYGSSFTNFEMERIEIRGPGVCLLDIPDVQSFGEELDRQYGELARVGRYKFENRYRDSHILFSGRKYVAGADGTGGMPYYPGDFPRRPAGGVALAHQSMLDHLAEVFDAQGGWNENMGVFDGAPHYMVICSHDTSDQILRSDDGKEDREDIRNSSMANELLKRLHLNMRYKRWIHVMDTQAPRFTYDSTTNTWIRVPYFKKEKATIGYKAEPNPDYNTAPYECITVIANRLGPEALMMPMLSNPGGNTSFRQIHNSFNFEFVNFGHNADNPLRNHGYFMGDAMEAINPRQSRYVMNLMVARNTNGIIFVNPTTPTGSVPVAATLKTQFATDQCGYLLETTACNLQEFTCTTAASTTGKANAIVLSPIRDGAVSVSDIVKVGGAGDVLFEVEAIASTGALTNNEVRLGYDGAAIDCASLVRDWKLYDSTTGLDVEA